MKEHSEALHAQSEKQALEGKRIIRGRLFRKLFLSYLILILVFLLAYTFWFFRSFRQSEEQRLEENARIITQRLETVLDQQILSAQGLCNSINTSETCRSILQSYYVEHTTIDAMQLYKMLNELSRIKGASSNMSIYNVLLGFRGDNRLFVPGTVLSVDGTIEVLQRDSSLSVTTVTKLLGIKESASIMLNKEYLIYAENYTAFTTGPEKGIILVLFEINNLRSMLMDTMTDVSGLQILAGEQVIWTLGNCEGRLFEAKSLMDSEIHYTVCFDPDYFRVAYSLEALLPVLTVLLIGLLFVIITYRLSLSYYQPIDSIGQMVNAWEDGQRNNELDQITESISSLIGERNGYRDQVVTMSPYARQGALHQVISGQGETALPMLPALNRAFLVPAILDVRADDSETKFRDVCSLLREICKQMSTESDAFLMHERNEHQVILLYSGDDDEAYEEQYRRLMKKLNETVEHTSVELTLGVGSICTSMQDLQESIEDAAHALAEMVTGGRGSLFFFEPYTEMDGCRMPPDFQEHLKKAVESGNPEKIHMLLEQLYRENLKERNPSPLSVIQLMEDLHLCVRTVVRELSALSPTILRIERMEMPYTAEEAFAYYKRVLEQAQSMYGGVASSDDTQDLETAVCSYINEHYVSPDLSMTDVADRFKISTRMVGVICKKQFGMNFLQYVRERQIQKSMELLEDPSLSLEEIATACGFSNVLTFRRNFKSVTGVNPSEYR